MHKSPSTSTRAPHQATSSANMAAANLPFSIEHILSSGSSRPTKHQQHQQQTMSAPTSQQQQQAAAMFVLNQAAAAAAAAAAASNSHQPALANNQQATDLMMFNEQIAMLQAAQQQHQHLLNPTTALAAAQHQLHQQWQQQQLMAAAAAAAVSQQQQHQTNQTVAGPASLGALGALNSLNSLAGQSHQGGANSNASTNHLLSCFMASMLSQHQQRSSGLNPFMGPLVEQHQLASAKLAPTNHDQLLTAHLAAAAAAAASSNQLRSPSNTSSSSNSTNSPVKQFFGLDPGALANNNHLNHLNYNHQHQDRSNANKGSPSSEYDQSTGANIKRSPPPFVQTSSHRQTNASPASAKRSSRCESQPRPSFEARQSGHNELVARNNSHHHQSPKATSNKREASVEIDVGAAGTALSSLTNFVSNSLAPIFGDDSRQSRRPKSPRSPSLGQLSQRLSSSGSGHHHHQKALGSRQNLDTSNNDYSGNESSHEDDKSSPASTRIGTSNNHHHNSTSASKSANILEAVSSALKGSPAPVATTINTTLAKAPPELVQKQPAWVFCTRYSDRPSSGPRTRRAKSKDKKPKDTKLSADEKRPRTAFTSEQLEKLREEFQANSYLDEKRRKSLAERLCLNENQIKIWFQNKRAKMKKQSNQPNPLRGLLVAGGLYNHSTATSDCSESYVNGLADDIGNRAMRDVEPEDGEQEEAAAAAAAGEDGLDSENHANIDRFKQQKSLADRSTLAGHNRLTKIDQDNNNSKQQQVTGDRCAQVDDTLKRRRTSQSDGDDEAEDNTGRNSSSSSAVIKRTKLNHMERNHNQRLASSHENLSRMVGADGDFSASAGIAAMANDDNEEEPVISVS